MKKIAPVIIAAIKKDGRFLLTKRIHLDPEDEGFYHGAWQLPGGGMEFGETPEETLRREILEEIGVIVQIETLVPKIYTEVRNRWQGLFIVYLCAIPSSSIIVLNDEASEYGWFTLKEVKKLRYLPLTTQILEDTFKTSALFTRKFELFLSLKGRAAAAAVQPPPLIALGLRPRF